MFKISSLYRINKELEVSTTAAELLVNSFQAFPGRKCLACDHRTP